MRRGQGCIVWQAGGHEGGCGHLGRLPNSHPAPTLPPLAELEAKRLGFYLFYNVKADFDRCIGILAVLGWASCVATRLLDNHPP